MGGTLYNRALEVAGKRFFLDKTPRYYFIIPELKNVFPEAKFIILLRNPLAVLSSILNTWFQNNLQALQKNPNYFFIGFMTMRLHVGAGNFIKTLAPVKRQAEFLRPAARLLLMSITIFSFSGEGNAMVSKIRRSINVANRRISRRNFLGSS